MQARSYNVVFIGDDAKISAFLYRAFPDKHIGADVKKVHSGDLTLVIQDTRGTRRFLNTIEPKIKEADVIINFSADEQQKTLIQKAKPECIIMRFAHFDPKELTQSACAQYLSTITAKIHAVEAQRYELAMQLKAKERAECITSFKLLNPITSRTMPLIFQANIPSLRNLSIFSILPKEVALIIGLKLKEIEHKPQEQEKCSIQ